MYSNCSASKAASFSLVRTTTSPQTVSSLQFENAVNWHLTEVFRQSQDEPHVLCYRAGEGAARFIYEGGALTGSSVNVVPSCWQEAINANATKRRSTDSMCLFIDSEFTDRV